MLFSYHSSANSSHTKQKRFICFDLVFSPCFALLFHQALTGFQVYFLESPYLKFNDYRSQPHWLTLWVLLFVISLNANSACFIVDNALKLSQCVFFIAEFAYPLALEASKRMAPFQTSIRSIHNRSRDFST